MYKLKGNFELDISHKYNFIYPLLLQEYIYALAHDRSLNIEIFFDNLDFYKKFSLLIVKRLINHLITQTYQQNSFFSNYLKKKNCKVCHTLFYQKILEGFVVVLEIPFSLRLISSLEKKEILKYHNFRSIHSIFPFLEDKFLHLNYMLDLKISHPIHIEILVQILRYWVTDSSFLHLLRFFFHDYSSWYNFMTINKSSFYFSKNKISLLFLYNVYVFEYESILIFLRNYSFYLRSISYKKFIERIYFYQKIKLKIIHNKFKSILWVSKDLLIHYVRYQGNFILASKGTYLLMNKWKFYLIKFWQYYFYMWIQPKRININKISNYALNFLGYLSSVRLNRSIVRSQMIENTFLIENSLNKFDTLVPITLMIQSLSKAGFCNILGHPMSKSAWTELSDYAILDRFGRIYRNISHYHSGSLKKKVYTE
uniref:Maturase K n=1 Tax=Monotropsis odorata TaxID=176252 RepID=A0A221SR61_9ERIC|nr:maturase K [Monotropsis odorata]ASN79022.1 maturase K [Monotropsis odorata]